MADTFEKTPDGQLKVVKTVTEEKIVHYDIDNLIKQRAAIQAQWDKDNLLRQAELDEVDMLIAEAKKLGIEEKAETGKEKK